MIGLALSLIICQVQLPQRARQLEPQYGVYGMCLLGQKLFFQGPEGILAYSIASNKCMPIPEFWREVTDGSRRVLFNNGPHRLIVYGGCIWTQAEDFLFSYDPNSDRLEAVQRNLPESKFNCSALQLLGVSSDGRPWLSYDCDLYFVDKTGQLKTQKLELPVGMRAEPVKSVFIANGQRVEHLIRSDPRPIGMTSGAPGDIIWCRMRVKQGESTVTGFAGYVVRTGKWTALLETKCWRVEACCFKAFENSVFVSAHDERADIYRYDAASNKWIMAAPPRSVDAAGRGYSDLAEIISVDASNIWCVDMERLALCVFSRADGKWERIECPEGRRGDGHNDSAVRVGSSFYIASNRGIWRYDLSLNRWIKVWPKGANPNR